MSSNFVHQSVWQNCICKQCRPRLDCPFRIRLLLKEQSDQIYTVCQSTNHFKKQLHKKQTLGPKKGSNSIWIFRTFTVFHPKYSVTFPYHLYTGTWRRPFDFLLTLVLLSQDIPCLCKQYRSRSVGFWRSKLIRICTVCHSVSEFISTIWIKEYDWLRIISGHGILIYSAWQSYSAGWMTKSRPWSKQNLIWVYNVCSGMSFWIFRIDKVLHLSL